MTLIPEKCPYCDQPANEGMHIHGNTFMNYGLTWKTETPTQPGWYWWRENDQKFLVYVSWRGPSTPYLLATVHDQETIVFAVPVSDLTLAGKWAGPLAPPEET